MEKLIITAAICGAEVTKENNPAVPYTVDEMVREAKSAFDAGAAVIHVHVREDDGTPTQDRERFRVVMDADYIEAEGTITKIGNTSRKMTFEARKVIISRPDINDSAADVLAEPVVVCRASGTCVVPKDKQRIAR